ncbi:hypothetical protein Pint_11886 [Pistacia integerrima]|uniref:Uncharacterized protein n=1 Tax=Pistacia integerrima TaxID=434235 RepID=A0ACC0XE58_9ROSI|nr:hypothetical protein Pint_11886 [Pistacia integerrima]
MNFVKSFKGHAQILENGGYTLFTPHYITWYCLQAFILNSQCKSQCINHGRYCAPDPKQDFGEGYQGKDVVFENLRQLCVHRVANESNRSWVWWDYVTNFRIRCSMKEKKYSKEYTEDVMKSLGLPIEKIKKCMGDPEADVENKVLKTELVDDLVAILPSCQHWSSIMFNIEILRLMSALKGMVVRVTKKANIIACKTHLGEECECPTVKGVQDRGDGYLSLFSLWTWKKAQSMGCQCPKGFCGNGLTCETSMNARSILPVSVMAASVRIPGEDMSAIKGDFLYIKEQDTCIVVVGTGLAGYVFYKYKLQYMPLNSQHNNEASSEAQPL